MLFYSIISLNLSQLLKEIFNERIKEYNDLSINKYGTIGSLMNGYLDSYLNRDEIEVINKNTDILNKKLGDFNIFKYKIINRYMDIKLEI